MFLDLNESVFIYLPCIRLDQQHSDIIYVKLASDHILGQLYAYPRTVTHVCVTLPLMNDTEGFLTCVSGMMGPSSGEPL